MDKEMLAKIADLFESGKITEDQKKMLITALHAQDNPDEEKLCVGSVLCCKGEEKEINIKLISEDLKINGEAIANQVNILQGVQEVSVSKSGDSVLIQPKKNNDHKGFFSSSSNETIIIQTPCHSRLNAKTVSGDIDIDHIHNAVLVKSVSGEVNIQNIDGNLTVITASGNISALKAANASELISKSGDITVRDSVVSGILKSYSGDIDLKNTTITDVEIAAFSGDIDIDPIAIHGNIFIKSFSGDIKLSISKKCAKELKYIQFASQSGTLHYPNFNSKDFQETHKITFNEKGSTIINIKTTSGNAKIILE